MGLIGVTKLNPKCFSHKPPNPPNPGFSETSQTPNPLNPKPQTQEKEAEEEPVTLASPPVLSRDLGKESQGRF